MKTKIRNFGLQLRVLASDQGDPAQTATTVVKLEILRNFQEPKFDPRDYNTEILETHGLGVSILQVRAKDDDTKVIYIHYMSNLEIILTIKYVVRYEIY